MFNDFIKHYNIIRAILRDVFLYGCFSREGLEGKRNLSSRKISYEIRRIQQYVESEFVRADRDGRNKLLALTYDAIRNTENFLVKTYMTKSFTRTDLILYFQILMILNQQSKALSFREIEEILIGEGLISYDNISSKTIERKLNEMCNSLGILNYEIVKRTKYYNIAEDILKDLDNEEISELTIAVALFKNILFPVTSGYYCENTLRDYLKYERGINIEVKDCFQYKNLHFHPIIEEQVLSKILKAIHERRMISLDYRSPKYLGNNNEKELFKPYKIRYDISCGRFYLVSYDRKNKCIISRLDRIEEVEISKFTYEAEKLKELYNGDMKYSWSSVSLSAGNKPEKVKLEIIIDESKEFYIIEKIKSEVHHGTIEKISEGVYHLNMMVNDSLEMVPWIRRYSGYINIIHGRFHILFTVLNECENGLTKKDIIKIIDKEAFQEKVIGKDFQSFEGLLLNEYTESENLNLLQQIKEKYYPNCKNTKNLVVPVRFTNIEKAWLKNLLDEPNLKLLLKDSTIEKLKNALKDVRMPKVSEIIETTNKSVLPEVENLKRYEDNFRILLKAIMEEKSIKYCNIDKFGNEYFGKRSFPIRFEYSLKDGRFRASMYSLDDNRPIMVNIFTMSEIEIEENIDIEVNRKAAIKLIHREKYSKEPIVLEVTDRKAAMERCFMSFSEMKRLSRCIEKDKYEMKLFYYTFEEEEIIRKILALGPYVMVTSPQRIVDEVISRIRRSIELNGYNLKKMEGSKVIELKGKYNNAKVYTDKLEPEVISQVIELCNQEFCKDSKIAIMPDTHAGKGCVIGFTADLGDKVIPNIVGVDIGCGMTTVELGKINVDLAELDEIIHKYVPSGMEVHEGRAVKFPRLQELNCYRDLVQTKRIEKSICTLGGGNHFIELNIDDEKNIYLVIHSGSRNLGKQVAEHYQNLAIDLCAGKEDYYVQREKIIVEYKKEGKRKQIQSALKELERKYSKLLPSYPKELCFLTGSYREKYLNDMNICQEYAVLNRKTMANTILEKLLGKNLDEFNHFNTTHNYINFKDNIIRKGSISAYEGEKVLIPINMRDGSILAVGKGNPEWNFSAPHGAGRLMSRSKAKEKLSLEEYKKSMEGIFTTSVNEWTLDEAPMAYKPMEEIINNIEDTVEILKVIKPIYNFKAGK